VSFEAIEGDGGAWILWRCPACMTEVWRGTEPPTADLHTRSCVYYSTHPKFSGQKE
jgi:hypothetical protein